MNAFSIPDEIARLVPADLDAASDGVNDDATVPAATEQWDQLTRNLARLGKQQLRANQSVEFLEKKLEEAQETAHEHRREATRLREQARHAAGKLLDIVDALDDVLVLARQVGDAKWAENLERLTQRTLRAFEQAGITEISALGEEFNPEEHEAIDTVTPADGQPLYHVAQVLRRGFRHNGTVLRPAEVITTR